MSDSNSFEVYFLQQRQFKDISMLATYLSSDTRFCRYSATATFIDKAFKFYLIVYNIIYMIQT